MKKIIFYLVVSSVTAFSLNCRAAATESVFKDSRPIEGRTVSKDNPCVYENGTEVSGTWEMTECAVYEQKRLDKNLDDSWQCTKSRYTEGIKKGYLSKEGYQAMQQDQEAWENFLKFACHAYEYNSGTIRSLDFVGCRSSLIKQRADYLNEFDNSTGNPEDNCLGRKL